MFKVERDLNFISFLLVCTGPQQTTFQVHTRGVPFIVSIVWSQFSFATITPIYCNTTVCIPYPVQWKFWIFFNSVYMLSTQYCNTRKYHLQCIKVKPLLQLLKLLSISVRQKAVGSKTLYGSKTTQQPHWICSTHPLFTAVKANGCTLSVWGNIAHRESKAIPFNWCLSEQQHQFKLDLNWGKLATCWKRCRV